MIKLLGVLLILLDIGNLHAQGRFFQASLPKNESYELNKTIQIGESLPHEILIDQHKEHIKFQVLDKDQAVVFSGKGSSLTQYIFDRSGEYTINFNLDTSLLKEKSNQCLHIRMPSKILLKVIPYRLVYHLDEMKLSSPLKGGNQEGSYLTIPVDFYTTGDVSYSLSKLFVKSIGIEANLIGTPTNTENLVRSGRYVVRFNLKGTLLGGTYIMLNFIDAAENDRMLSYQEIVL